MNTIRAALQHGLRTAVVDAAGSHRYKDVLSSSARLHQALSTRLGPPDEQPRVAIMCDPGHEYVAATWATWLGKGIAVPLCLSHPDSELEYVLRDSGAAAIIASPTHQQRIAALAQSTGAELVSAAVPTETESPLDLASTLDRIAPTSDALMIYTSGTTGRPKGVVHMHSGMDFHTESLCHAWGWQASDRILHTLPLHHIHGLGCALLCALSVGACVEFMPRFSPTAVWDRLRANNGGPEDITLFMGVPTMYAMLINAYNEKVEGQEAARAAARAMRLWVSGSAACPPTVHRAWKEIAGQIPLERFGMTETGICISNPWQGERRIGTVGQPLPGLDIKLEGGTEGDIRVKGPQLFRCYWQKPEATEEAFDENGYFKTGDQAVLEGEPPYIRIRGRSSVDIIKHGGYKISALDIEAKLLRHPALKECAVVGLPDATYGEVIGAVVAFHEDADALSLEQLRDWARDLLPPYQLPTQLHVVEALPRNAMGKVNKKDLRVKCFPDGFSQQRTCP